MYALLLKINHPNIKFRDLQVAWIPGRWQATREDIDRFVEVNSYLSMIKTFLKDKAELKRIGIPEDIFDKILEKSPHAFDASEYSDKVSDELIDQLQDGRVRPEQVLNVKVTELNVLLGGRQTFNDLPKEDRAHAAQLWRDISRCGLITGTIRDSRLTVSTRLSCVICRDWLLRCLKNTCRVDLS